MINSLYDNYKFWSESGSIYLFSDPHFNDEETKSINPNWIDSDKQIEILNNFIHKNDTLICLGDCGDVSYIKKLKAGNKILIKGNHDDKGNAYYKRKVKTEIYNRKIYTEKSLRDMLTLLYPGDAIYIADGKNFGEPGSLVATIDDKLFDEVYGGPIFISDKMLLSHEPIFGLPFCVNIHGHNHGMVQSQYFDNSNCKHLNLAADVIDYTPVNLGELIKKGLVSDIQNIHRITIDGATERKNRNLDEEVL